MSIEKYLNGERTQELWTKIKTALSGKQDALAPDETITMQDGGIGVAVPVKPLTQAEYDALPEEEKQAEAVYLVDEPPWTPALLSIQEYDTEDGWHVRKWSTGYVEMSLRSGVTSVTSTAGNGCPFPKLSKIAFPVPLVQKYSETATACDTNCGAMVQVAALSYPEETPTEESALAKTGNYWVVAGRTFDSLLMDASVIVTGRWK